jgi:hypothetical protein
VKGSALASLLFAVAMADFAVAGEALRIGEIRIRRLNVFSPEEAKKGWFYRAADAIHVTTREDAVRKFLLFKSGDHYDQLILEQTERNLRRVGLFKFASVTAGSPHDGVVDVDVVTQDAWTLTLGGSLGSKGGVTTWSVSVAERNLLGTMKSIDLGYDKGTERTDRAIQYSDPAFVAPYWTADLTYADNTDGGQERALVQRPFASFLDPFALTALYDHLRLEQNIYGGGVAVSRYTLNHRQGLAAYARSVDDSETHARRVGVAFDSEDDAYGPTDAYPLEIVPDDHHFRYLSVFYQEIHNDFVKFNYINRDVLYEDFNLAPTFFASFAVSPSALGLPQTTYRVRAAVSAGLRVGRGSFVAGNAAFDTRLAPGVENAIFSSTLGWIKKWDTPLIQTTVSRLQVDWAWNPDKQVQFLADGSTGLRGYRLYAFEGDRRVIFNLEHRIFSGREILQLVSPGMAVFFDTGYAAPRGTAFRFSDLKSDIGLGLRFGITRASGNNILRVDLAYALNEDQRGRKGWLLSFSSGQSF